MYTARRYSNYVAEKLNEQNSILDRNDLANKLIESFLSQKDVAPWFRGTSYYHILGSDKLFNALRDDAEQRTTHRVRSCLNLIGLEPMITSKQITFLMRLSRCNDLIFLWFLMEMHYKTPKPGTFSVNEQLICSAICHLDMITTLRELDKILPSGHTSRIEMNKARINRSQIRKQALERAKTKNSSKYVLPYFDVYPRPEKYGKRLTVEVPTFKVDFDMYNAYSDPNYNVQNETNRWFACYKFNTGKRVVHAIIREILENIFCSTESVRSRLQSTDILCTYHRNVRNLEIKLKQEKIVQARNNCLKEYAYFKTGFDRQRRVECCRKLLDVLVEKELTKLKRNNQKDALTLKTVTSKLKIFNVILGAVSECDSKLSKEKICKSEIIKQNHNINCNDQTNNNNMDFGNINNFDFDFDYINDTPTPSEMVFHCPVKNKPYSFDYEKIFLSQCKDDDGDDKTRIQKMCLNALETNISNLSNDIRKNNKKYDRAVTECAKSIFENKVKQYEEANEDYIATQAKESLKPLNQYPTLANYNAEDHALMDQMLSDAFQYLRKNPKFVWAQLPDAHKVPMLREWIARRFGKEYSPKKRYNLYRNSCKIFRALDKSQLDPPEPDSNKIGKNKFANYDCRNYIEKKVKGIKNKYYYKLDTSLLNQTRIFWFAMRGYLCANGPPRKTFFAYMPSKYRDIQHFRLWKSTEYRNYKGYRNDRQYLK